MSENTEIQFSIPESAAELPANGAGREGLFNQFLDAADKKYEGAEAAPVVEDTGSDDDQGEVEVEVQEAEPEAEDNSSTETMSSDDEGVGEEETQDYKSFEDLVAATGLEPEQLSDLEFKVTINGETQTISHTELMRGYRRQADLTRGFQEVAELKRKDVELKRAIATDYQERVHANAAMLQALNSQLTIDDDRLEALRVSNPAAYGVAVARNKKAQELVQQGVQQIQELQTQQQKAEDDAANAKRVAEIDMFMNLNPHLRDDAKRKEFGEQVTDFLSERGFTADEMDELQDHRVLQLVADAMRVGKGEKLRKSVKEKTVKKVAKKVMKSKPASQTPAEKRRQTQHEALANRARSGKPGALADFVRLEGLA